MEFANGPELSNNNTIIFTISRMNPPTPGHLLLIQKLIEEAIRQNVPKVYVILSKTNDNNENPIDCPEKINVLKGNVDAVKSMINGLKNTMIGEVNRQQQEPYASNIINKINQIEVICLCVRPDQKSPIAPLYDIVNYYSDIPKVHLFMIIGDDRADFLDTIVDCMLFKIENVGSVNGQILIREEMESYKNYDIAKLRALDIPTMPKSAFSASFVRKLVTLGLENKFRDVYSPYLEEGAINRLYVLISKGLNKKPLPKKNAKVKPSPKSEIVKPPKYIDPMVKANDSILQKRDATEISNCDCDDDENNCSLIQTAKKGGGKKPTSTKKYRKNTRKYTRKHPRKSTRKRTRKNTRKYSRKRH